MATQVNIKIFRLSKEGERVSEYIRNKVKEAREAKGYSQRELCESLKRSNSFISQVESGRLLLTILDLIDVAEKLGEPFLYFLPPEIKRDEDPKNLSDQHWRLIRQFDKIESEELRELAIKQIKQLAEIRTEGKK